MYEPTEWKKGDVVTSQKLNKLEQGVANAVLVVNGTTEIVDEATITTLDKTWQEIADAPFAVIKLVDPETNGTWTCPVLSVFEVDGVYALIAEANGSLVNYECDDPDGYPSDSFSDDDGGGGGGDDPPPDYN